MTINSTGLKFLDQIESIENTYGKEIKKDISKLSKNKTDLTVFNDFKKKYYTLFDGTHRKFTKSSSVLGAVRRAYANGKVSSKPFYQERANVLEKAYAPMIRKSKTPGKKIIKPKVIKSVDSLDEDYEDMGDYEPELTPYQDLGKVKHKTTKSGDSQKIIISQILNRDDILRYFRQLEFALGEDTLIFPRLYVICEFKDEFSDRFFRTLSKVPNRKSSLSQLRIDILDLVNSIPTGGIYDFEGLTPENLGKKDSEISLIGIETVFCG